MLQDQRLARLPQSSRARERCLARTMHCSLLHASRGRRTGVARTPTAARPLTGARTAGWGPYLTTHPQIPSADLTRAFGRSANRRPRSSDLQGGACAAADSARRRMGQLAVQTLAPGSVFFFQRPDGIISTRDARSPTGSTPSQWSPPRQRLPAIGTTRLLQHCGKGIVLRCQMQTTDRWLAAGTSVVDAGTARSPRRGGPSRAGHRCG